MVVSTGQWNGAGFQAPEWNPCPPRQTPHSLSHTAMSLVTPVATVVVAITQQFPGDTDATGTQKALTPSADH